MKQINIKSLIISLIIVTGVSACEYIPTLDEALPDKRREYQKSRSLPDLEVPPDLTIEGDDDMVIPGEAEPTTLTAYELQKKRGGLSQLEMLAEQYPGEKVLPVPGGTQDVWPGLVTFWKGQGYEIDLEDAELGVLETEWLEETKGDSTYREKYKVFAEPTETGNNTILFVSSERQEKIGLGDTNTEWLDQEPNDRKTDRYVAGIKTMFYGDADVIATTSPEKPQTVRTTQPVRTTSQPAPEVAVISRDVAPGGRQQAILENVGNEQFLLRIPENIAVGWALTGELLNRIGADVEKIDSSKGIYFVYHQEQLDEEDDEGEGLFDKLAFWKDEEEPESYLFLLSVSGVDGNTEIIVLNEDGEWEPNPEANKLLSSLMDEYNY